MRESHLGTLRFLAICLAEASGEFELASHTDARSTHTIYAIFIRPTNISNRHLSIYYKYILKDGSLDICGKV